MTIDPNLIGRTEHSIEELERQLQAARDRRRAAQDAEREAEKRLQDARNEQSGLIGHLVEYQTSVGFGRTARIDTRRIVVTSVGPKYGSKLRANGIRILKSGSKGTMRDDALLTDITDLGPYVEPGK